MDKTGCPAGFMSDFTMSIHGTGKLCGTSEIEFWIAVSFGMTIRLLLTLYQLKVAWNSTKKRGTKNVRSVPYTTVAETVHTILNIFGWIAFGLGVVDARNGTGPANYVVVALPMYVGFLFSCIKMVNLGQRVIPRKYRAVGVLGEEVSKIRNDNILVMSFSLYGISLVASVIFMIVLNLALSPGSTDTYTQVGQVFLATAYFFGLVIINRQTHRIVGHISKVQKSVREVAAVNNNSKGANEKDPVFSVMSRMKVRSNCYTIVMSCTISLSLVGAIKPSEFGWKFILAVLWSAMITSAAATYMYLPRSRNQVVSKLSKPKGVQKTNSKSGGSKVGSKFGGGSKIRDYDDTTFSNVRRNQILSVPVGDSAFVPTFFVFSEAEQDGGADIERDEE